MIPIRHRSLQSCLVAELLTLTVRDPVALMFYGGMVWVHSEGKVKADQYEVILCDQLYPAMKHFYPDHHNVNALSHLHSPQISAHLNTFRRFSLTHLHHHHEQQMKEFIQRSGVYSSSRVPEKENPC